MHEKSPSITWKRQIVRMWNGVVGTKSPRDYFIIRDFNEGFNVEVLFQLIV